MSELPYKYMVRIVCMTYNHAPYIEDALNGFCMQQTSFPFVAIIVDDASTDGEPEVIKNYLNEHFDMKNARTWETDDAHFIEACHNENTNCTFAVILLKYNFYSIKKTKDPLIKEWMDCKYIALCEGDDYWTDSQKLQQQIAYLETHSECGMVYSNIIQYVQAKGIFEKGWCKSSDFRDMLMANKVCTATTCFRKEIYDRYRIDIKPHKKKWVIGDYPMWLYFFANSKPYFNNKIVGVYRVLEESASHCKTYKKWESFCCSSYDIIMLFAKKYRCNDLLPLMAYWKVRGIIEKSDSMGGNTSVFFLPLFLRYKLGWKLYLEAITTHNRFCRKTYIYLKYINTKIKIFM